MTNVEDGPRVSVIIPAYGHAQYILEALDSVFGQTYANYEVIVVNDGSPDNTADIVRPLVDAGRIRYVEQANTGQAQARNRGIQESKGEYIALLDDDDVWPEDHLQWQAELLETLPDHVGVGGTYIEFGTGADAPDQPATSTDLGAGDFIDGAMMRSPGQVLLRKDAVLAAGGFDPVIRGADDWDLYLQLSKIGPIRLEPRIALRYRVHGGNASRNYWRMYQNALRVYRKHQGLDPKRNPFRWIWGNPSLARIYRHHANVAAQEASGSDRLIHRIRARWCSMCLLPRDVIDWVRITGGSARRSLRGGPKA